MAEDRPADTLTITPPKPLRDGANEIASFTLREPLVGEVLRSMDRGGVYDQVHSLIAVIAGIPKPPLATLPASVYMQAERYLLAFLHPEIEEAKEGDEPQDTLTIEFAEPIKVGETERSRIVVTEPTLSMLSQAAKAGGRLAQDISLLALASMPSGGSPELIERMRFGDFARARSFIEGFTGASARTI